MRWFSKLETVMSNDEETSRRVRVCPKAGGVKATVRTSQSTNSCGSDDMLRRWEQEES